MVTTPYYSVSMGIGLHCSLITRLELSRGVRILVASPEPINSFAVKEAKFRRQPGWLSSSVCTYFINPSGSNISEPKPHIFYYFAPLQAAARQARQTFLLHCTAKSCETQFFPEAS